MHRYVAFLRGINVGGHTVVKAQLQEAFNALGYQNVSTYKQSGNVIFEADSEDTQEIRHKIESKLYVMLGYEVSVFLRTPQQLRDILSQEPFKGQQKEGASYLVTFLATKPRLPLTLPLTIPKSTAQVISAQGTEFFSVTHGGGEGALPNPFLEKTLKTKATTRNINITNEIIEKIQATD
jgi:uncharacterized protein (DUF1697 family)